MHSIETWGDLACFARPETKVERWSYPCPTPSAARGIFDAIYVKPVEFRWQVMRIEILSEPRYIALRRNEVKDVGNMMAIQQWITGAADPEPIWADGDRDLLRTDEKGRTQRQTMALKNVRYRLHAEIRPWPDFKKQSGSFSDQFERRIERGKCFTQPVFGAREFPAYFRPAIDSPIPHQVNEEVGIMLYDVFDLSRPGRATDAPAISVFRATIRDGVLDVPPFESDDVLKGVPVTV
jgi:CRISPR-associated protein Cas5d